MLRPPLKPDFPLQIKCIVAAILADNVVMQRVSRKTGFKLKRIESEFHAEMDLSES